MAATRNIQRGRTSGRVRTGGGQGILGAGGAAR